MTLQHYNRNLPANFSANKLIDGPTTRTQHVCKQQQRNGLQTPCNDLYCNRGVVPKINRTVQRISPTKIRMIIDIELSPN